MLRFLRGDLLPRCGAGSARTLPSSPALRILPLSHQTLSTLLSLGGVRRYFSRMAANPDQFALGSRFCTWFEQLSRIVVFAIWTKNGKVGLIYSISSTISRGKTPRGKLVCRQFESQHQQPEQCIVSSSDKSTDKVWRDQSKHRAQRRVTTGLDADKKRGLTPSLQFLPTNVDYLFLPFLATGFLAAAFGLEADFLVVA